MPTARVTIPGRIEAIELEKNLPKVCVVCGVPAEGKPIRRTVHYWTPALPNVAPLFFLPLALVVAAAGGAEAPPGRPAGCDAPRGRPGIRGRGHRRGSGHGRRARRERSAPTSDQTVSALRRSVAAVCRGVPILQSPVE